MQATYPIEDWYLVIYKEFSKLNRKKIWLVSKQKMKRHVNKEDLQMTNKHIQRR